MSKYNLNYDFFRSLHFIFILFSFNRVVRDISIRPGGQLQIAYGVTLKFLPSVGIMVGGHFHAEGSGHADGSAVKFTLFDPGRVNATDAPVRLVGGRTRKDGRLQVNKKNLSHKNNIFFHTHTHHIIRYVTEVYGVLSAIMGLTCMTQRLHVVKWVWYSIPTTGCWKGLKSHRRALLNRS